MTPRTFHDYLRDEYSSLLPQIRVCAEELEAEVRHLLIPINRHLDRYERIVIKTRIKECESAIASLERRKNWSRMRTRQPCPSLTALNDLAGIRILAFPKRLVLEIEDALHVRFTDWVADPVPPVPGSANSLALKYHGFRPGTKTSSESWKRSSPSSKLRPEAGRREMRNW